MFPHTQMLRYLALFISRLLFKGGHPQMQLIRVKYVYVAC